MPFVCDLTEIDVAEDGSQLPSVDQFVYLLPPDFHSGPAPTTFSTAPVGSIPPVPSPVVAPIQPRKFSIWNLLRGRPNPAAERERQIAAARERRALADERDRLRTQQLFSIVVPALRAARVRRVYCRYDGGNDEGFGWLDHYESNDGRSLELSSLGRLLSETKVFDTLIAAGLLYESRPGTADPVSLTRDLGESLSQEWASLLLGRSFGTGEYVMYGAFTVDLEECTIIDDPNAKPMVENIQLST